MFAESSALFFDISDRIGQSQRFFFGDTADDGNAFRRFFPLLEVSQIRYVSWTDSVGFGPFKTPFEVPPFSILVFKI